jgi:hypothetical protein
VHGATLVVEPRAAHRFQTRESISVSIDVQACRNGKRRKNNGASQRAIVTMGFSEQLTTTVTNTRLRHHA